MPHHIIIHLQLQLLFNKNSADIFLNLCLRFWRCKKNLLVKKKLSSRMTVKIYFREIICLHYKILVNLRDFECKFRTNIDCF